jgi:hypothetical protein
MRFVEDKAARGHDFSDYFGFPCQSFHCSTPIINHHPVLYNMPVTAAAAAATTTTTTTTTKKLNSMV